MALLTWVFDDNQLPHEIILLIIYAATEDSGKPAYPRSLTRDFAIFIGNKVGPVQPKFRYWCLGMGA